MENEIIEFALKQTEQYGNESMIEEFYSILIRALKQTEQYGNNGSFENLPAKFYGFKID